MKIIQNYQNFLFKTQFFKIFLKDHGYATDSRSFISAFVIKIFSFPCHRHLIFLNASHFFHPIPPTQIPKTPQKSDLNAINAETVANPMQFISNVAMNARRRLRVQESGERAKLLHGKLSLIINPSSRTFYLDTQLITAIKNIFQLMLRARKGKSMAFFPTR